MRFLDITLLTTNVFAVQLVLRSSCW